MHRAAGVALTIVAWVLASCSSTEAGTASPAPKSPAEGQQDVPSVSDPLDVTPFLKDPCTLLPGDEPDQLGYANPEPRLPETDSTARLVGPSCSWPAKAKGGALYVGVQTENAKTGMGGMQGIHDAHFVTGQYPYYEPTEVDGYPAAFADVSDLRDQGETTLSVGITDDMTFSVSLGPLGEGKRTEADNGARTIAEAVIKTLKNGK